MSVGLSVKAVAAKLGASERTVRRYLADGKLTGHRIVREHLKPIWQVDADSVQRLLDTWPGVRKKAADSLAKNDIETLREELSLLRQENAELQAAIERLALSFDDLRERLLPPVKEEEPQEDKPEVKVSWWCRTFMRKL